ncbi:MAG: nuclear transport factor 2 family protein, partial [Bacteroidota bacterium]
MKFVLIFIATILSFASHAQTTEDSVKAAVKLLFTGMLQSDAAKIQSAFADSAVLQTISNTKEGKLIIKNDSVKDFAEHVSKLPKDSADEHIVFETIKIDGPLASVWTPYKFYYAGKFSHCGVDSYQLVRINGQWK